MRGLRGQVVKGLLWRSGVAGGHQVTQVLFTILLARLLTTHDFGLVAMAFVATRLVQAVSQVQLGSSLVRDRDATEPQVSGIFVCHLGINAVASAVCCAAAPLAAAFFEEPRLTPVLQVLAWGLLVSSLSFPTVLLRRRMEFGGYSAVELGSTVVANVAALVAALGGLGVWSLVVRLMTQRLVFAAGVWWIARWRPVRPSFEGIGRHMRFGLHLLGSATCSWLSNNAVAILIGKLAGAGTLGCFSIAFNLAVVPAAQVREVLTSVLTPAFAILKADPVAFRKKAYAAMFGLGLVYIPAMFGLAAVARPFILFAYGEAWADAAGFLVLLAGVGLIEAMEHLLRSIILAAGRSASVLRITAIEAASTVLFVGLAAAFLGSGSLAAAYLAASVVSLTFTLREAGAALGGGGILVRALSRSFVIASVMAAVVLAVAAVAPWRHGVTLLTQVLVGAAVYLVLRLRLLTPEERGVVRAWPLGGLVAGRGAR